MSKTISIAALLLLGGCFGPDKLLHAGAGLGAGVVTDGVLGDYGCEAAIAIGIAKEMIDPVFSIPDVIATSVYCFKELL